jgi:hypothetical protein
MILILSMSGINFTIMRFIAMHSMQPRYALRCGFECVRRKCSAMCKMPNNYGLNSQLALYESDARINLSHNLLTKTARGDSRIARSSIMRFRRWAELFGDLDDDR